MISKYIAGWEINFNDPDELRKILLTQGIDNEGFEYFKYFQSATEIVIQNNLIVKTIDHSRFLVKEEEQPNLPLPILSWRERKPFHLKKSFNGIHSIGGEKPKNFNIPEIEGLNSSFIYLGTIDCSDEYFNWIGIDKLHLTYPIYEGIFEIFFDYSDPNNPKVINPETFEYSWLEGNYSKTKEIYFNEQKYSATSLFYFNEIEKNHENYMLSGVPLWYQYPQIPICPKTGNVMEFVTTINADEKIKLPKEILLNLKENINFPIYDDSLNFGSFMHMFVFFEPSSKVLHLNCQ